MDPDHIAELQALRDEITRCLADALRAENAHLVEIAGMANDADRADKQHDSDIIDLIDEVERVEGLHTEHVENLERALESRDLIGQAKGVIMLTTRCSADRAFELLVKQSQFENRKVIDLAAEITNHAQRPRAS